LDKGGQDEIPGNGIGNGEAWICFHGD